MKTPHPLIVGVLFALFHLPLVAFAYHLYASLQTGSGITDLGSVDQFLLCGMFLLPYVTMRMLGWQWNPERARSGEPEPW